jgi:hypothetical protein
VLNLFGGYLPNGREISASTVPQFADGQRALVFLRNTTWSLSPVVGLLAFDIRSESGADLVYHSDNAVVGISESGIQTQSTRPPSDSNADPKLQDSPATTPRAITVDVLISRILAYAKTIDVEVGGGYDPVPTLPCKTWNTVSTIARDRGAVRSSGARLEDKRRRACLAAHAATHPKDFDWVGGDVCLALGGQQ